MKIAWRLRMAAAQREVWTGAQLRRLLAEKADLELSAASVSALLTKEPTQVKLSTLLALCTALDCTPNDLLDVDTTPVECHASPARPSAQPTKAVGARGRVLGGTRPAERQCLAPGLMEGLIQRKDEDHGGTEEVPGRDPGAGDEDGRGSSARSGDAGWGVGADR